MKIRKDFEEYVDKNGPGGCWIWLGATSSRGYGYYAVSKNQTTAAHILMYKRYKGEYGFGLHLDHIKEKCQRKDCVNPDHLEPVSCQENIRRGRVTKITQDIANKIKEEARNGKSGRSIAYNLGLSHSHVCAILRGEYWS